jgi:chemotaxis protein histidine kinase CheA
MHTVKGLAATLGIRALAGAVSGIERALGDLDASTQKDALVAQLTTLVSTSLLDIKNVADALRQALPVAAILPHAVESAMAAESIDVPELVKDLDELAKLLRSADMRALEVFEHLQHKHAVQVRGAFGPIDEAIGSLDFDLALAQCQALKKRFQR